MPAIDGSTTQGIPLADAAMRLGVSWQQAWRLLLTGTLQGRKDGGRWVVDAESLERTKAARDRVAAA